MVKKEEACGFYLAGKTTSFTTFCSVENPYKDSGV
jgi:hypothetical protein